MEPIHMFGCGLESQLFKQMFENLSPGKQEKITCITDRSWLTLMLRYEININTEVFTFTGGPWGMSSITDMELPSIEVYLLITCLDTLAGQNHKDFDQWIKLRDFQPITCKEDLIALYHVYQEECGVSKNLKSIFINLPTTTKEWLINNVKLMKIDSNTYNNINAEDSSLIINLFKYYYDFRRNPYTHTGQSRQTWIYGDIYDPLSDSQWITPAIGSMFVLDKKKQNQKWRFSFRQGLDEATILRIILHSVVLQLLGINVTKELIQAHISHLSRIHIIHAFIREVSYNAWLLNSFKLYIESGDNDFLHQIYRIGFPLLAENATKIAINRYKTEGNPLETGEKQMTIQYLNETNNLNAIISEYNINNAVDKPDRVESIENFINKLMDYPSTKLILDWPQKYEMTNLWIIIRDPCYL